MSESGCLQFLCSFPHGAKMAAASPALRSASPGARLKGHASQMSKLLLENVPENPTQHFLLTCQGYPTARENGNVPFFSSFFFLVSWKIATCQNTGVLLVRRDGKIDFEYLSAISAADPCGPAFLSVPLMQNEMINWTPLLFLANCSHKMPFSL